MIHYATVHHGTDSWIDLQLKHISHYTSDYKVWCQFSQDLNLDKYRDRFHFAGYKTAQPESMVEDHYRALDDLAKLIISDESTDENDVIVFIDSDSIPINPVNEFVNQKLKDHDFVAVQRVENVNSLIPHPCFAFCTVKFWKENQLTWSPENVNHTGKEKPDNFLGDPGGMLYTYFNRKNIEWGKLHRDYQKSLFVDGVLYSVYDDIVYHHGGVSRTDRLKKPGVNKNGVKRRPRPAFLFRTRATPVSMQDQKHFEFFNDIFEQLDQHIFNMLESGWFLKDD